jgi:hypothetical protein
MSTMHARRRLTTAVATLGAVALLASSGTGPAAAESSPVRKPKVANLANPGVVKDVEANRWVVHGTGSWTNHPVSVSKTHRAAGSYGAVTHTRLLAQGTEPAWMGSIDAKGNRNRSVWAPAVTRAANGTYVAFFAVTVKGAGSGRCIGTGTSTSAKGPFTANARALACWQGSGANPVDVIASEGKPFTLIDPAPVWLSSSQLVLTYKTGFRKSGKWHTTTRLLQLDPNNPTRTVKNPAKANGGSIKIADELHKYIEENPVLAKRGTTYTLFTSFGWYGTCDYITRYHQSRYLWSSKAWLRAKSHNLSFPSNTNTCGRGNAQVAYTGRDDGWLIYFNGHASRSKTTGGPKNLYVGSVGWKSTGTPYVTKMR